MSVTCTWYATMTTDYDHGGGWRAVAGTGQWRSVAVVGSVVRWAVACGRQWRAVSSGMRYAVVVSGQWAVAAFMTMSGITMTSVTTSHDAAGTEWRVVSGGRQVLAD